MLPYYYRRGASMYRRSARLNEKLLLAVEGWRKADVVLFVFYEKINNQDCYLMVISTCGTLLSVAEISGSTINNLSGSTGPASTRKVFTAFAL